MRIYIPYLEVAVMSTSNFYFLRIKNAKRNLQFIRSSSVQISTNSSFRVDFHLKVEDIKCQVSKLTLFEQVSFRNFQFLLFVS